MIRIDNVIGTTTVTAGFGADWVVAGGSFDQFRFTSVQDSYNTAAERDVVEGFDASGDTFVFDGIDFATSVTFVGSDPFTGTGSEARLSDLGGGFELLEIDVDGDGTIGANDMTIELFNLNGTLTSGHFLIV